MLNLTEKGWILYSARNFVIHKRFYLKKDAEKAQRRHKRTLSHLPPLLLEEWDGSMDVNQWRMWKQLQK